MKIMDIALAPPQPVGLAPQRGGEIAGHQRHEEEHGEVDHLARLGDRKAVKRREKEEIENGDARECGDHRRADAPADRRDDHRDQIKRRMKLERRISRHQRQYERRCADHQQRENEVGQRCAEQHSAPSHGGAGARRILGRGRCSICRGDALYMRRLPQPAQVEPNQRRPRVHRKPAARRHADPSRRSPDRSLPTPPMICAKDGDILVGTGCWLHCADTTSFQFARHWNTSGFLHKKSIGVHV